MRSWLMLKQAVQLAQDIGMFQSRRRLHFSGQEKSIGMQRASTITALGILVLNSCASQHTPQYECRLTVPLGRCHSR